ncbi:hypothetical protein DAPPUDRAFT_116739 [Daphnia pulex]|uniref:Uncharacterized protein n=1 Tax=Daphnia pulex TaxID=6669 RepID=E9HQC5_DAPPU|nr:hypothetical protein DAPPUDRAFT_116739 [Daphnia pulex]|eukprot:EFX66066.1 hypothetical protein DAPPUDRAFT_116739 [Daphnia pulex]
MAENNQENQRTILEKTFALTSQRLEGTVTLLDLTVELRKIPATVEHQIDQPYGPIVLATTRLEEGAESNNVNGAANGNGTRPAVPVGVARQEIIDLTESSDEEDDATVENPDLEDRNDEDDDEEDDDEENDAAENDTPVENEEDDVRTPRDSPPPYSPDFSTGRRRYHDDRNLRSPTPPGYVPPTYLQNMYSPPILLRSEAEYRFNRRDLIRQYNRDSLDLYYKYEFQAQQLKRARRQFY